MAKKSFKTKKLNLRDHQARMKSLPPQDASSISWVVAFAALALALGLLLLNLQR